MQQMKRKETNEDSGMNRNFSFLSQSTCTNTTRCKEYLAARREGSEVQLRARSDFLLQKFGVRLQLLMKLFHDSTYWRKLQLLALVRGAVESTVG
jgi:hypothetical protein